MPETQSTTVDSAGVTRTPSGEITNPQPSPSTTSTTQPTAFPKPIEQTGNTSQQTDSITKLTSEEGDTFLTEGDKAPTKPGEEPPKKEGEAKKDGEQKTGAPEKYEAFKAPEGYEFTPEGLEEVNTVFKEYGLTQEQGQKLMDMYGKNMLDAAQAPYNHYLDVRKDWRGQIDADPVIGSGNQSEVKAEIGRAIAQLDPQLVAGFRKALNLTGIGDHPDFVRGFYSFAKMINEGRPVRGNEPSVFGQSKDGPKNPTAAQAIYPHLKSNQPAG